MWNWEYMGKSAAVQESWMMDINRIYKSWCMLRRSLCGIEHTCVNLQIHTTSIYTNLYIFCWYPSSKTLEQQQIYPCILNSTYTTPQYTTTDIYSVNIRHSTFLKWWSIHQRLTFKFILTRFFCCLITIELRDLINMQRNQMYASLFIYTIRHSKAVEWRILTVNLALKQVQKHNFWTKTEGDTADLLKSVISLSCLVQKICFWTRLKARLTGYIRHSTVLEWRHYPLYVYKINPPLNNIQMAD